MRKKRIDLNITQEQVAKIIGASGNAVFAWENNQNSPRIMFVPKIIEWLGYVPNVDMSSMSYGDRIVALRRTLGISQGEIASQLKVGTGTIRRWERNETVPNRSQLDALDSIFGLVISAA
ncbi:MAG: helix-turn-helix domain-containing protein [Armatimonadota bacterium]